MEKSEQTLFEEKASLIYEYDNRSPLFVRKANKEIDSHNLDSAIDILKAGITLYPEYPSAHILLGKALSFQGKYSEALLEYKQGSFMINSPASYNYYSKELEEIKKMRSPFAIKKRTTFVDTSFNPSITESQLSKPEAKTNEAFDDSFSLLAQKIAKAKITIPDIDTEPEFNPKATSEIEGGIVSETLAKIYVAQGKIPEAIKIYEILMRRNPQRANDIVKLIQQLRLKMQEQQ